MIFFFKYVHLKRVLPESIERTCGYISVHIAFFYRFAFFCKLRHGIFVSVFFYKMHCFKWRRRKVANNYVLGLYAYIDKMASMVIFVFSMIKGSILEVEFILISRGKKLNQNELASVLSPTFIINLTAILFLLKT